MMPDAFLLSPYRPPTSYPVSLNSDEASAWLNGYFALWHPAVVVRIGKPPSSASSYDHDQPSENAIYALAEGPHLYQPDDWPQRILDANAVSFRATADRTATLAEFARAMPTTEETAALLNAPDDIVRAFAGVGFGYVAIDTLFEAMEHDKLLDVTGFWSDVTAAAKAVGTPEAPAAVFAHLKSAAEKLRSARESLNSNPVHLLDWAVLDAAKLDAAWPASLGRGLPMTVLASAELLARQAADFPERFAELKGKFLPDLPSSVDLCCGSFREREDALMPVESQLWNLSAARKFVREQFKVEAEVYGRKRSAYHPQLPAWLQHLGFRKALLVSTDGALIPSRSAAVVTWSSPDGKSVEAFGREPLAASDPLTFFNLGYTLNKALTGDSMPCLAIAHKGEPAAAGYAEMLAVSELAPVFGDFTGLGRYLADNHYGEYLGSPTADDYFTDYLDDRVTVLRRPDAVSGFAKHYRLRRRLDSAFALAALHRSLTPATDEELAELKRLEVLEDIVETQGADIAEDHEPALVALESSFAKRLAERVQARAEAGKPGLMVFNPCGFARRVALELPDFPGPIPVVDPVKAAQFDGKLARLVVEVPALGFAWIPRTSPPGTVAPKARIKTADGTTVRNEFFEAELDPVTGGLRSFRDMRTRINRFGMFPIYNPGSKSVAKSITVTASGSALGEVTAEGQILDEHNAVLANFKHRIRAWVGRPALEMSFECDVVHKPTGYPWHAYYGLRFGWRDERSAIYRGVNGSNASTTYTRPVSADYLELRFGKERTFLFTGGLPFLQKHGTRMADLILIPEGEEAKKFEMLLAFDRDFPMPTATGWAAPTPVVYTEKGPPPMGTSGWLGHLDLPSLLLTSLRPCLPGEGMGRAVAARFIECAGFGGNAEFRFAKDAARASTIDGEGNELSTLTVAEGGLPLEFSASETFRVKAEWL